ncbi:hypothetical protein [Nocardia aurea]|uniref:ABC transporter permease n=1 Tax=Nocardia aurea TaxID=2144174 RepID=A0ABV3G507_9NOCA
MTTTETSTRLAEQQAHLAALSALDTKKAQILYACEQMHRQRLKLTGTTVRAWLAPFGVEVGRASTATVVTEWCREHDIVRTGDLAALTTEMLAELDVERGRVPAAPAPTEQSEQAERTAAVTERSATEQSEQSAEASEHRTANTEQNEQGEQSLTEQPERTEQTTLNGVGVRATTSPVERAILPAVLPPVEVATPQAGQAAPVPNSPEHDETEHLVLSAPNIERTANEHTTATAGESPAVTSPVVVEQVVEPVKAKKPLVVWPVMLMALSAFVSIWSGWVGLGEMTGFGVVEVLPGISEFKLNTAITLPIGVEAYASYALYVWLSGRTRTPGTKAFAKWSAIASLSLGAAGQIAYHLLMQSQHDELEAAKATAVELARTTGSTVVEPLAIAPWWITTFVACLPVIVVGMGAALAHMVLSEREH